jgi:hypothetical protein
MNYMSQNFAAKTKVCSVRNKSSLEKGTRTMDTHSTYHRRAAAINLGRLFKHFLIAWVMAENSRAALYLSQKVLQVQIVKLYFLQDLDLASEPSTLQQYYSARTKGLWHFMQSTPGHHKASMNVIIIVYFPKVLRVDLSENALGCVKEESCIGF